jgi:protein-S-isoprenylcysteine O-methyltransferase Ste14
VKSSVKGYGYVVLQFFILALIFFSRAAKKAPVGTLFLGEVLLLLGLVILVIAGITLRSALTAVPEPKAEAPLVTTGIYKRVRHPMYLGLILIAMGISTIRWSAFAAYETVILIFLLISKYRYEDGLLLAKWPEAISYQVRVGALLPIFAKEK